jgi:hypothetical protein
LTKSSAWRRTSHHQDGNATVRKTRLKEGGPQRPDFSEIRPMRQKNVTTSRFAPLFSFFRPFVGLVRASLMSRHSNVTNSCLRAEGSGLEGSRLKARA